MDKRKRAKDYIKKLKAGKIGFDKLFHAFFGYLKYVAYDNIDNKYYVEDVTVDSLMQIYDNVDKCDETRNVYAWMVQITKNTARDYNRRNAKYVWSEDVCAETALTQNMENERLLHYDLAAVLQRLDDTDRMIVVRHAVYDMTFASIADMLGMPPTTVQSRYYAALKQLSNILKKFR